MPPAYSYAVSSLVTAGGFAVAVTAVNGTVATGSEGNFGFATAAVADYVKHLPFAACATPGFVLPATPAFRAAGREVFESFLSVELLFTCCKYELVSALLAGQDLVFKCHSNINPFQIKLLRLPVLALPYGESGKR